jgi:hypothetical protein
MANFKEYHSFGGVDIHAVLGDQVFGELQMVAYRLDRDKNLVFTLGSANARSIARGKRYISGSCVFVVFDRDSLLEAMDRQGNSTVYLDKHETANYRRGGAGVNGLTDAGRKAARNGGTSVGDDIIVDPTKLTSTQSIQNTLVSPTKARLSDQLLPFDITLVGANEYGHTTKMVIYGVEIMSESGGVSIDDMVLEKQMQFLARSISNWEAIDTANSR